MKETVLLTGGAGFIGSHIAVELLQRDYDVVIADDLSNSRPDVPERIEKITGRTPVFYRMDVSDRQALDRVFRAHDIAATVHLAGYKAVGESVQKPLAYYRNNLDTTLALLEVMADHGVHRLIFSSSATVYGNAEAPCREDMPTGGCTNPYAWTKLMIEQILRDAAKADPSLAAVCLRYFNPVGAHESGLIGELPNGIPNNLMPYITQTAAGIRRELTVFGNDYPTPDGTGVRDYIHVVDLARGHAAALDYSRSHPGWEAINLGTGRGSSVLEIVETFQRVNGVAVPHRIGPRRPGDLPTCYAATDKAARLLHWHAEKDLADMCRDSWRWQQSQQSPHLFPGRYRRCLYRPAALSKKENFAMPIRSRAAAAAVHILTALCAAVGVVLQCGFFGGRLNLAALQYFTLMSNILCAVYFAGAAVRTLRRGDTWLPVCKGALVMAMAITGITFHLFLAAGDFNMGPTQLITNHLLHTAAPLLTVLDWLLFDEKGHYRRFEPFLWGIFPATYFVYTMIRARVSSFRFYNGSPYPYPFMDVDALGWGKVLLIFLAMAAACLALGYVLVWIDHLLARRQKR